MFIPLSLEDTNLVGNVHGLGFTTHTHERLLETQGRNNSIHLRTLHIIELVNGVANLSLVGTNVHEESENILRLSNQATLEKKPQSSS